MSDNQPLAGANSIIEAATRVSDEYIQFEKLYEGLKMAKDAARMIAYKRGDTRWIAISGMLARAQDRILFFARQIQRGPAGPGGMI